MTKRRISYAQNAEDIRVWRAFADVDPVAERLTYVDVGANEPRHLSITASLSDLGWSGLLIEADPDLAAELRVRRPRDMVAQLAAAAGPGELTFYRVPGTGLGTLDASEADAARARGFEVEAVVVQTEALDDVLDRHGISQIHFMSIDVEGAEAIVLQGLSLTRHRPWVLSVEAVQPGTSTPSHHEWEPKLFAGGYTYVAYDGVNRWYVSAEHEELAEAIAVPFNAIDAGEFGWVVSDSAEVEGRANRAEIRRAWQRELILHDIRTEVPTSEYEKQIDELRMALITVEGSRSWQYSRRVAKVGRVGIHKARQAMQSMPAPVDKALVRRRHLRHVTVNMGHLTDPAYLGTPPVDVVGWITPDGLPPIPARGYDLHEFSSYDIAAAKEWLAAGPYDTDALLDRRTDNHGDEVGRTIAALRLRLDLAERPQSPTWAGGNRVLFDARCLQSAAFGNRGIGRFAKAALLGAREAIGDDRLVLLVDPGLEELPDDLAGDCDRVTRVDARTLPTFSVLVQPSPMTASADPLIPILHSNAHKIAVVFDFIPMHYPTIYLRHVAGRTEYAAALDALKLYDDFVCISHLAGRELAEFLGRPVHGAGGLDGVVAWPRDVLPPGEITSASSGSGPIVVMTGDEPRKNTFGALAAIGAATAGEERDVVVIGMAGQETRVHHWSIAAAMRPGEARTTGRLSDEDMHRLLAESSLVVVASFDEGLSLPVIEALRAGTPVVASDIPSHRELIGQGTYLADPASPASMEKAIRRHRGKASTQVAQMRALARHQHATLESVIGAKVQAAVKSAVVDPPAAAVHVGGKSLDVGIGTPWSPQKSGVADFSTTTTIELARLCDVTIYTTADADVPGSVPPDVRVRSGLIDDVQAHGSGHDVFVSVLGNSHFHVPFLEVLDRVDAVSVAHDTRMVELYMALRSKAGAEQVMLRGTGRSRLDPPLDDQIDDMRLLENAGFWEIARRSRMLVMHSPSAAPRIEAETGVTPRLLPFANQRAPQGEVTEQMRADARRRLGFDEGAFAGTVHIASFGFVDVRTKMTDVVIESAAWLSQWGHRVSLHLAGAAGIDDVDALTRGAREAGIANFQVTGFLSDEQFRDYLLAVDLGLQLRISPLLGVSGPLSDLAAYGTASVASAGLAIDVDTPAYVDRLPDDVSPVMVAEAIERRLAEPMPHEAREQLRREYLARKSPRRYAELLLDLLQGAR
jgi:FkbM family methyltransferase